jgi:hypothetical protein
MTATLPNSLVGRGGLEPPTSRLSGVRSNHLSYRPKSFQTGRSVFFLKRYEDGLARDVCFPKVGSDMLSASREWQAIHLETSLERR